jgi:hypothetical protein
LFFSPPPLSLDASLLPECSWTFFRSWVSFFSWFVRRVCFPFCRFSWHLLCSKEICLGPTLYVSVRFCVS